MYTRCDSSICSFLKVLPGLCLKDYRNVQYGKRTEILSAFIICILKKAVTSKKVYRMVYIRYGRFWEKSHIQVLVNLRLIFSLWKLPWSMTINLPTMQFHWPQNCVEVRGQRPNIISLEVKSGVLLVGL